MLWWHALILGLVEGLTEYLPVSSTGHLILASALMGLDTPALREAVNDFNIIIQGGAILAVLGLYWPRVVQMLRGLAGKDPAGLRLLINLFVAFLPAAVFGLLLDKTIEKHLFATGPVLLAVLVGGLFMMLLDGWRAGRFGMPAYHGLHREIDQLEPLDALKIGLLQCIAMWPGTSRSMMTIAGGMTRGLRPKAAAEFSFLLGLPTLGAATLYKLAKNLYQAHKDHTPNMFESLGTVPVIIGILVATVSAALAVKWLVGFLNRHGLTPFGWYRVALCVVMAFFIWRGVVQIGEPHRTTSGTTTVPALQMAK